MCHGAHTNARHACRLMASSFAYTYWPNVICQWLSWCKETNEMLTYRLHARCGTHNAGRLVQVEIASAYAEPPFSSLCRMPLTPGPCSVSTSHTLRTCRQAIVTLVASCRVILTCMCNPHLQYQPHANTEAIGISYISVS